MWPHEATARKFNLESGKNVNSVSAVAILGCMKIFIAGNESSFKLKKLNKTNAVLTQTLISISTQRDIFFCISHDH